MDPSRSLSNYHAPFTLDVRLKSDLSIVSKMYPKDGENLIIVDGALQISQRNTLQEIGKLVSRILTGDEDEQVAVVNHLSSLAKRTMTSFSDIDTLVNNCEEYELQHFRSLKSCKRLIKDVALKISDLQYYFYRDYSPELAKTVSGIYTSFRGVRDKLKSFLQEHPVPSVEIEARPLEFDLSVNRRKFLGKMPRGATPQDILKLFKSAEAQPQVNPLLLESYARALLITPFITDDHIDIYCELAKQITFDMINQHSLLIDAHIVSGNVEELLKLSSESIAFDKKSFFDPMALGSKARETLEELIKRFPNKLMPIDEFLSLICQNYFFLRWIDTPNESYEDKFHINNLKKKIEAFTGKTSEDRKMYFLNQCPIQDYFRIMKHSAYISTQQMIRIINASTANHSCKTFDLSYHSNFKALRDRLLESGFIADPENKTGFKRL